MALGIAGAGIAMAVGGIRKKFLDHLSLPQTSAHTRRVVEALLIAVAAGLVTFGVYSFCEARWRDVQPG